MGIIYYQMLYGCRPFGEGQTQEQIVREGVSANVIELDQLLRSLLGCLTVRASPLRRLLQLCFHNQVCNCLGLSRVAALTLQLSPDCIILSITRNVYRHVNLRAVADSQLCVADAARD